MISKEKLVSNLNILRNKIPQKPDIYTSDHPISIKEALEKYSRQRTVHLVETFTYTFNNENWPLPLWFDPKNIRVGFWNKLYYKRYHKSMFKKKYIGFKDFHYLCVPSINNIFFKQSIDESLIEAFDVNITYIQNQLESNVTLQSKSFILKDIFRCYKKKYWISCISTLFPLLDYVTRKLLKTKNLRTDIKTICKLFEEIGFSIETVDYLMPHITLVNAFFHSELTWEEKQELQNKIIDNKFGLIGPALSSFLRFANSYYSYYSEDKGEPIIFNRHAILHGSINEYGTQVNAIKLLTFLYLFLELEPIFEILLDED